MDSIFSSHEQNTRGEDMDSLPSIKRLGDLIGPMSMGDPMSMDDPMSISRFTNPYPTLSPLKYTDYSLKRPRSVLNTASSQSSAPLQQSPSIESSYTGTLSQGNPEGTTLREKLKNAGRYILSPSHDQNTGGQDMDSLNPLNFSTDSPKRQRFVQNAASSQSLAPSQHSPSMNSSYAETLSRGNPNGNTLIDRLKNAGRYSFPQVSLSILPMQSIVPTQTPSRSENRYSRVVSQYRGVEQPVRVIDPLQNNDPGNVSQRLHILASESENPQSIVAKKILHKIEFYPRKADPHYIYFHPIKNIQGEVISPSLLEFLANNSLRISPEETKKLYKGLKTEIWNNAKSFSDPLQKNNAWTRERHRLTALWKIVFDIDPEKSYKDGD